MRWARVKVSLGVIVGPLVFVFHKEAYGCAESHFTLDARLDLNKVFLVALWVGVHRRKPAGTTVRWTHGSGQVALSGSASTELGLDVLCSEAHSLDGKRRVSGGRIGRR